MTKVLVVDDTAFARMRIRMALEKNGFEVIGEAENGRVAVAKYKELRPDIVTLDITMPEMPGIEALGQIMQYDPQAKVVMVSAMGQKAMVTEAIVLGAKSFIVKPFNDEHVVKTLRKVLSL